MKVKLTVEDCYHLNNDFQNQFISNESKPKADYVKLRLAERTVHKVHYRDVFVLEPKQYYKISFKQDVNKFDPVTRFQFIDSLSDNGLMYHFQNDFLYLFNASDNQVFLRKGTVLGEVIYG